jgi:hypothetical protein
MRQAPWRNGRRNGLKIRSSERGVPVRVRPGPPRRLPFCRVAEQEFEIMGGDVQRALYVWIEQSIGKRCLLKAHI